MMPAAHRPWREDCSASWASRDNDPVRVLLLGGTGFLGPEVVGQLVRAGHDVTVFHRGTHEADLPASVEHLHGDRANLGSFGAELRRASPEVAIDMRPMTEDDASAFVRALSGLALRCVVISSADVYRAYGRLNRTEPGPPDPVPLDEDAPLRERLYADRDAKPHDRAEDGSGRGRQVQWCACGDKAFRPKCADCGQVVSVQNGRIRAHTGAAGRGGGGIPATRTQCPGTGEPVT